MPKSNVFMWVPGKWAQGSEMRGRDRTGDGVLGVWILFYSGQWEPVNIEWAQA